MSQPLVSVVIAAYRSPEYLHQAVESVLAQTFDDYEVIVVDDASGEDTISRYQLPERVRLIVHADRARAAAARNTGIRAARGKYIALLDQDDVWCPEKLSRQVSVLESNPEIGLVFTDYVPVDEKLTRIPSAGRARWSEKGLSDPLRTLVRGCFIATPSSVLVRKSAAEAVGLFDESVVGASDWDFYLRLARGYGFAGIAEQLVLYRMHPGQIHRDDRLMRETRSHVYERTLAWASEERPELVTWVRQCYCRVLYRAAVKQLRADDCTGARETVLRAIQVWSWSLRNYWLLIGVTHRLASKG